MGRDYQDDVRSLVWFLGGIGIGAAVALLFAPQSGRETRRMIIRTAERGREYLGDRADELRELYETGRESAQKLGKDVHEQAGDLLDRSRKFVRS